MGGELNVLYTKDNEERPALENWGTVANRKSLDKDEELWCE